ncbi:MAG: hypothetical protein ACYCS8_05215 [Acidithiobacillus sp.]
MTEYTIREKHGCTFVFGDGLPINALAALTSGKSTKGKVMAPHLARLAGAIFAWGKPQDVAAATEKYTPIALARVQQNATPEMLALGKEAIRWLAIGQHGMSACSIFWKTTGVKPDLIKSLEYPRHHPVDPDDLGRCRLLLEQVPCVADRFESMAHAGLIWEALVEHWGWFVRHDGSGSATVAGR